MEDSRGLILVLFDYSYVPIDNSGICIHEEIDKDRFTPDGQIIAYVKSNFCYLYHETYKYLTKESIAARKEQAKTSNRGRKPLNRPKKNRKQNGGTNTQFGSSISFGVISDIGKVHGVKIFRKASGNISKITYPNAQDKEYIPAVLNKLFAYLNANKPGIDMKLLAVKIELANISVVFAMPPKNVINLTNLRMLFYLGTYTKEYWECDVVVYNYNGKNTHLVIILTILAETDRAVYLKLTADGNLYIYGSKTIEKANFYKEKIFRILHYNQDQLVARGYRASPKPKPRPDFAAPPIKTV